MLGVICIIPENLGLPKGCSRSLPIFARPSISLTRVIPTRHPATHTRHIPFAQLRLLSDNEAWKLLGHEKRIDSRPDLGRIESVFS